MTLKDTNLNCYKITSNLLILKYLKHIKMLIYQMNTTDHFFVKISVELKKS